jgi:hypothetical protein
MGVVVDDWLPQFEALPGSGFSVELKASDHPDLWLSIHELDPVVDDVLHSGAVDINPLLGSRSISMLAHQAFAGDGSDGDCLAEYRLDVDVRLLEPGLDRGPVLSQ